MVTGRQAVKLPYPFIDGLTRRQQEQIYEDFQYVGTAQGSRWRTVVIAASDSSAAGRAGADYRCQGTSDEVVINLAITTMLARATSASLGRIVLLEGTYSLAAKIAVTGLGARSLAIEGMGAAGLGTTIGGTKLVATGGVVALELNGDSASAGSACIVENLSVTSDSTNGTIAARDMSTVVRNCVVKNTSSGAAIIETSSTGTGAGSRITNNVITASSGDGILVDVGAGVDGPTIVSENIVTITGGGRGIVCDKNINTVPTYIVTGNAIQGSTTAAYGIKLNGNTVEDCVVADNVVVQCLVGIECAGYRHNVSGNLVESCPVGISTGPDSQHLVVVANHITGSSSVGVRLSNTAIRPTVLANRIGLGSSSYAVTIAAGVTYARVQYNVYDDGYVTAAVQDLGTNTVITTDLPAGGASNYVLKKLSATTGDFGWALDPAIDIAVAKGDLLVASGLDALSRLAVRGDGRVLETDSAATNGVKWGRKITSATTAPTAPEAGDIWLDTT